MLESGEGIEGKKTKVRKISSRVKKNGGILQRSGNRDGEKWSYLRVSKTTLDGS